MQTHRFVRLAEVSSITGLSRSRIYALEKEGRFPSHVELGAKTTAWVEAELRAWVAERIAGRGKGDPQREKLAADLNAKREKKLNEKKKAAEGQRTQPERAAA